MEKNPESIGASENRFIENDRWLLGQLTDCDELKHKIATRLVDLGIDTSVNKPWPVILGSLQTYLMNRFEANRDYCERNNIRLPKKEEGLCELFLSCGQLYKHLQLFAQEGWYQETEDMISPFRAFAALGNYWKNRMQRCLENGSNPEKDYDALSKKYRKKLDDRFEEMMGLPFELIEPLLHRSI